MCKKNKTSGNLEENIEWINENNITIEHSKNFYKIIDFFLWQGVFEQNVRRNYSKLDKKLFEEKLFCKYVLYSLNKKDVNVCCAKDNNEFNNKDNEYSFDNKNEFVIICINKNMKSIVDITYKIRCGFAHGRFAIEKNILKLENINTYKKIKNFKMKINISNLLFFMELLENKNDMFKKFVDAEKNKVKKQIYDGIKKGKGKKKTLIEINNDFVNKRECFNELEQEMKIAKVGNKYIINK